MVDERLSLRVNVYIYHLSYVNRVSGRIQRLPDTTIEPGDGARQQRRTRFGGLEFDPGEAVFDFWFKPRKAVRQSFLSGAEQGDGVYPGFGHQVVRVGGFVQANQHRRRLK